MSGNVSAAARLLQWWQRLKDRPGGRWLFARILGAGIPYTGTIRPHVLVVEAGWARVALRDRRRVRNHLNSIHALAIANVGELTTGLAVTAALPQDVRSILTQLNVQFLKKARGSLVAECRCEVPAVTVPIEFQASSTVTDARGVEVAVVTATWLLSRMQ
ncbi:MAG TPA: DUF4442 domain-containing protein [Longimicrobiales bacterium]